MKGFHKYRDFFLKEMFSHERFSHEMFSQVIGLYNYIVFLAVSQWAGFQNTSVFLCSTMWSKTNGATKRKNRDGRRTNSELNRKTIRATAKCKSKPSKPEGPSSGDLVGASSTGVASESSGRKDPEEGGTLPSSSSSSTAVASGSCGPEGPLPGPNRSDASSSSGVTLDSAGNFSACFTSQSKAFEECPNAGEQDGGQMDPQVIADMLLQKFAWGPHDPEI